MNRGYTVTPSLIIIILFIIGQISGLIPYEDSDRQPVWLWRVLFLLVACAFLRVFFLYFQTFDASMGEPRGHRRSWLYSHYFFGLFASILYYYKKRFPKPR